ncbi:MAG: hypothetical protein RLY86_4162 [Pseudomonadota bacterium]
MNDEALEALVTCLSGSPRALALIGAGASIPSGYPSWTQMLEELNSRLLERRNAPGSKNRQVSAAPPKLMAMAETDTLWQAEILEKALGDDFYSYVEQRFGPKMTVREPFHLLARLPFAHYLTTNYDPCIDRALREARRTHEILNWAELGDRNRFIREFAGRRDHTFVVHLHGRHDTPRAVIMTESSYVRRYVEEEDTRLKLLTVFMTHPVVFIGFSLADPDLAQLMREVTFRLRAPDDLQAARHFAVMGARTDDEEAVIRSRMMGKYGILPVFYRVTSRSNGKEDHSGLRTLLHGLRSRLEPTSPVTDTPTQDDRDSLVLDSHQVDGPDADPNKGRFGGKSVVDGWSLALAHHREDERNGWIELTLTVTAPDGRSATVPRVRMHLHPTFPEKVISVPLVRGQGEVSLVCFGAFTVGVDIDDGWVRLELDLAEEKRLPEWFRAI